MNIYCFTVIMDNGFTDDYQVYAPNKIVAIETLRAIVEICADGEMVDFALQSVI